MGVRAEWNVSDPVPENANMTRWETGAIQTVKLGRDASRAHVARNVTLHPLCNPVEHGAIVGDDFFNGPLVAQVVFVDEGGEHACRLCAEGAPLGPG
jgi:hypothetical protein